MRKFRTLLIVVFVALGGFAPSNVTLTACAPSFDPSSKVTALRILSVTADKPYAKPGNEVRFQMTYVDPLEREHPRDIQITWIGGCFDPQGDQYYGCFQQFQAFASKPPKPSSDVPFKQGIDETTFSIRIPDDIITRRPVPEVGPHYGIAYVFFAVCAGHVKPIPPERAGSAGSFPLGCFDEKDHRLGADSFVPGFTQVYAFEDGRMNDNPRGTGLLLDGAPLANNATIDVESCAVTEDARSAEGCRADKDPTEQCRSYKLDLSIDPASIENDPYSTTASTGPLNEILWVDYFAEDGDLDASVKLVSDAKTGAVDDHSVKWIPPSSGGATRLWAVVHDARGGSAVFEGGVNVRASKH